MRPLTLLFVLFSFSCLAQLPRPVVLRVTEQDMKKRDHLDPHKIRLGRLPEDTAVFFTLLIKNTTNDTLTQVKLEDCHFFARAKGFDKPLAPGDTLTLFLAEHPHQRMKENRSRVSYIRITARNHGKPLPYYDVELQYAITRMQRKHGHHWSRENPGVRWGVLHTDSVTIPDTLYAGQHVLIVTHFQNTGTTTLRIDDAFSLWPESIHAKAMYFPKTVAPGLRDSIVYEGDVVSAGGMDTLRYNGHYSVDANQFPQQFVEVPVHAVIVDSMKRRFRVYFDGLVYRDGSWYSEKKFYYATDPKQERDIILKQPVPFEQGRMQVYFRNGISSMTSFYAGREDSMVVFDDHFRRLSRSTGPLHRRTTVVFDTTGIQKTLVYSREKFSLALRKERDQTRSGKSVLRLKIRGDWTTAHSEHIDYQEGKPFYRKVETRHGSYQKEWFYNTNTKIRTVQQPLFRRTKIITWKNGGRTVSYRPFRSPGPKYPGPHRKKIHYLY